MVRVVILFFLRMRLLREVSDDKGARSDREVNWLNSRSRVTRLEVKGADGGRGEREDSWFEPACRVISVGNRAAMWHISCQVSNVSSRASSFTPSKASPALSSFLSSSTLRKRFQLTLRLLSRSSSAQMSTTGSKCSSKFRLRSSSLILGQTSLICCPFAFSSSEYAVATLVLSKMTYSSSPN